MKIKKYILRCGLALMIIVMTSCYLMLRALNTTLDNMMTFRDISRREKFGAPSPLPRFEPNITKRIPLSKCPTLMWDPDYTRTDIEMFEVYKQLSFNNLYGGVWKQGWQVTYPTNLWNATNPLKVIVVPHSHTDPGWLMTYTQYYNSHVVNILNNMLVKLEQYPEASFIFAEIAFFHLWWNDLNNDEKQRVQRLVDDGRFEIVTGGWVMNDEASTHYFAILDQLIEGHLWLNQTLGLKPTSAWTMDTFGHSPTMSYMFGQSGITGMLMHRVHYAVKKYLAKSKQLEFMWRQTWDSEWNTDVISHVMPFYAYDIPHTCGPDPSVCCGFDFVRRSVGKLSCPWKNSKVEAITESNVEERSRLIVDQWKKKAMLYKGNVVLVPLGDDFRYETAEEWDIQFTNYFKLFEFINSHSNLGVHARFGTLSDYFRIVGEEVATGSKRDDVTDDERLNSLSGDFVTYADTDENYWSGYFTSRPFQKYLDRKLESHLRGAEILFTLASTKARRYGTTKFPLMTLMERLITARRNLGLFQHHDAITGTSKDNVVIDYTERLVQSLDDMKKLMRECAMYLTVTKEAEYNSTAKCYNLDESISTKTFESNRTILDVGVEHGIPRPIMFYNSLGYTRKSVVSILVNKPYVLIRDNEGRYIPLQVEPYWTEEGTISKEIYQISFEVLVSGLGVALYTVQHVSRIDKARGAIATVETATKLTDQDKEGPFTLFVNQSDVVELVNSHSKASFDRATGLLQSILSKGDGVLHKTKFEFVTYGTKTKGDKSGAYLFHPDGPSKLLTHKGQVKVYTIHGPIRSYVRMRSDVITHTVTIYNSTGMESEFIEIENIVDIRSRRNCELAMRVTTDIDNTDKIFYTDLNGFQIQKRRTHSKIPIQGNFYPMTTMAFIQNDFHRHSILSASSHGFSSLDEGVMEVMLDRRLNQDDNRGVKQGVTDNKPTPSRFRFLIENCGPQGCGNEKETAFPSPLGHHASMELNHPLFKFPNNPKFSKTFPKQTNVSPLSRDLPCDLHLLNLRSLTNNDNDNMVTKAASLILHRIGLDCMLESTSDICNDIGETLDLSEMFRDSFMAIYSATETSLTMMHTKQELNIKDDLVIKPMHIKTIIVKAH